MRKRKTHSCCPCERTDCVRVPVSPWGDGGDEVEVCRCCSLPQSKHLLGQCCMNLNFPLLCASFNISEREWCAVHSEQVNMGNSRIGPEM